MRETEVERERDRERLREVEKEAETKREAERETDKKRERQTNRQTRTYDSAHVCLLCTGKAPRFFREKAWTSPSRSRTSTDLGPADSSADPRARALHQEAGAAVKKSEGP